MQVSKEPSIGIIGLSLQELNEAEEARPCQGSRRSAYGDATRAAINRRRIETIQH